jgi:tetratricopeptide (TPR) repeat protein
VEDSSGELPDFDLSDFAIPEASAEPAGEISEEDLGIEPAGEGDAGPDISGDFSDNNAFDLDGAEADSGAPAGDAFDNFNLDQEMSGTGLQAGDKAEAETNVPGIEDFGDEFSLPGIDDLLAKPAAEAKPAAPKAGGPFKAGSKKEEASEEVEEIRLNDEELKAFQKNLAACPLNLRIACEELIVEQAVPPNQMSRLIKMLIRGAPVRETAALAGKILGKTIDIPKGFEKSTGEALEAEQASFAYIFVHNFLPVLRLFAVIAVLAGCLGYLIYRFIYTPLKAESIYKTGYERIFAGEYERANERFSEAFSIKRVKDWFYKYAEAFRDERQYYRAEAKYDELLRYYPRDKKGVLDYAALETNYLFNYQKANNLLQRELLDYAPNDFEGLLAFGDNNLAWGEVDPSKYDDARFAYARLLQEYGWTDPVVERMMKYFIRTDNLKETLPLYAWFVNNPKRKLPAETMAELGGYLLDKRLEEVRGVPNEYVEQIEGIRDLLLNAVKANPSLPEPHYHLARYYQSLDNSREERITLEVAIRAFDAAREESVRRRAYRIDAHRRYANNLINSREFAPAEEQLVRGVNLYEDALSRRLISRSPDYGRLYAGLGDLEYFTKTGDMEAALNYYHRSEQNGWAPPEMQYRMGAAYYQLENWGTALEYLFTASSGLPLNRRLLFALGNTALKRGDYFAAQGYYNRLLDILETQRARLPVLLPNDRPEYLELAERLMMARNNAGVAYEALAGQTGDRRYRTRAQSLYVEANRAWDARTRDPRTMIRSGSIPLPYLNSRNTLYPQPEYEPQIFIRIDRDALEPSRWEELAPMAGLE